MEDYERELRGRVSVNENDCWIWSGPYGGRMGYGRYKVLGTEAAHRASHLIFKGPIPEDRPHVCHTCDNPPCVNPEHLFAGTHQDNIDDMIRKGRHRGNQMGSKRQPEVGIKIAAKLIKVPSSEFPIIQSMIDSGKTLPEIALHYNVSHTTIYRIVHERMKL